MARLSRRQLLAGAATTAVVATAGCSAIAESLASSVFQDVNVLNGTERRITGSITVTDPDDETVLDEAFDLLSGEGLDGQTETEREADAGAARYDGVFTASGTYTVTVQLDEDSAVDGVREAEANVDVTDTESDNVLVTVGDSEGTDEPITIRRLDEETETG
jgi:hypothetical protein